MSLTKTQKSILNAIEDEFNKINNQVGDKPFGLISKDFFDREKKEIDNEIKEIGINNQAITQMILDMIQRDIKRLNKDIFSMGLIATQYVDNKSIRIDVKGEENTNFPILYFNYETLRETIYHKDGRASGKLLGFKGILYYTSSTSSKIFNNLEELVVNKSFVDKIRQIYDKVRNNY